MNTKKDNFTYAVSRFFTVYLPGERGFSENTIASYRDTFKQFLLYCHKTYGIEPEKLKLSDFSRDMVNGFLAKLEGEGKSASTRNQRMAALKSFFGYVKYAFPDYLDISSGILSIRLKKQPEPTVSYMTDTAVASLLRQPDCSKKSGYRDMLILTLLYDSGARVSEITQIRVGDIRTQNPATITLHGKGNKDRIVPVSEKTNTLIKNYILQERLNHAEYNNKWLFVNRSGKQFTRAGVTYILKKYADVARSETPELIPEKISPHCLRHSKAMHLLQAGVALIYIRDFLGHESVKTTEVYAKADSKSKRHALETAYASIGSISDMDIKSSWNCDDSLMAFLNGLCGKNV